MNLEAGNAHAAETADSQGEEAGSWDPYLVKAVNKSKDGDVPRMSESMSAVLDEMGDMTVRRRATLIKMARKAQ